MIFVLDTTFLAVQYFSGEATLLAKTREILRASRKQGNKAIVPTIVLAEFYAQTCKRTGREVADKYFRKIVNSGHPSADVRDFVPRRLAEGEVQREAALGGLHRRRDSCSKQSRIGCDRGPAFRGA